MNNTEKFLTGAAFGLAITVIAKKSGAIGAAKRIKEGDIVSNGQNLYRIKSIDITNFSLAKLKDGREVELFYIPESFKKYGVYHKASNDELREFYNSPYEDIFMLDGITYKGTEADARKRYYRFQLNPHTQPWTFEQWAERKLQKV